MPLATATLASENLAHSLASHRESFTHSNVEITDTLLVHMK